MWKHLKTIRLCLLGKYRYYSIAKAKFLGSLPHLLGQLSWKEQRGSEDLRGNKTVPCCSYLIAQTHNATSGVWRAPHFTEHFHVASGYTNGGLGNPQKAEWCLLGVGEASFRCELSLPDFQRNFIQVWAQAWMPTRNFQMGYLGHVGYSDRGYSKTSRSSFWVCRKLLFLMVAFEAESRILPSFMVYNRVLNIVHCAIQ